MKDKKSEAIFEMPAGGVTLVAKWAKKEITTGGAKTDDKDSGVKAPIAATSVEGIIAIKRIKKRHLLRTCQKLVRSKILYQRSSVSVYSQEVPSYYGFADQKKRKKNK